MELEKVGDTLKRGSRSTTPIQKITEPKCTECGGTGFYALGRYCGCGYGAGMQKKEWLIASGVASVRESETLESFKVTAKTREALAAAQDVVSAKLNWLLLYGGTGNGKTHLGHGIVMASIEGGRQARIVNALVLLSDLRALMGTPAQTVLLRELATIPLLVVDDLIWATDLEARWLEEVIQRRYMTKRPLVATTNRDLKDLPKPLVSRFWELGKVVLNEGEDYRRGRGT